MSQAWLLYLPEQQDYTQALEVIPAWSREFQALWAGSGLENWLGLTSLTCLGLLLQKHFSIVADSDSPSDVRKISHRSSMALTADIGPRYLLGSMDQPTQLTSDWPPSENLPSHPMTRTGYWMITSPPVSVVSAELELLAGKEHSHSRHYNPSSQAQV